MASTPILHWVHKFSHNFRKSWVLNRTRSSRPMGRVQDPHSHEKVRTNTEWEPASSRILSETNVQQMECMPPYPKWGGRPPRGPVGGGPPAEGPRGGGGRPPRGLGGGSGVPKTVSLTNNWNKQRSRKSDKTLKTKIWLVVYRDFHFFTKQWKWSYGRHAPSGIRFWRKLKKTIEFKKSLLLVKIAAQVRRLICQKSFYLVFRV